MLEEMALSRIEAESSTLKHLERGNHSDCDSDNGSDNSMISVVLSMSTGINTIICISQIF